MGGQNSWWFSSDMARQPIAHGRYIIVTTDSASSILASKRRKEQNAGTKKHLVDFLVRSYKNKTYKIVNWKSQNEWHQRLHHRFVARRDASNKNFLNLPVSSGTVSQLYEVPVIRLPTVKIRNIKLVE